MLDLNLLNELHIDKNNYVVVGVSAGPDSMCLLNLLITNNYKVIVAHINYHKRQQSDDEQQYLQLFCNEHKIIMETLEVNSYTKENFQQQARTIRYNFFEQLLSKYKTKYLMIAHHGDDLIETIFLKIIRGSNLKGYGGMMPITRVKDYYILRPLLKYSKQDIINYNDHHQIKYFIDDSNNKDAYTRNRIRHHIIPILYQENQNIVKKFNQYAQMLNNYDHYMNDQAITIMNKIFIHNSIDLNVFTEFDPLIQDNILTNILLKYNIKIKNSYLTNIRKIISNTKPNLELNISSELKIIKSYQKLMFITNEQEIKSFKIIFNNFYEDENCYIKKIGKTEENGNDIIRLSSKNTKFPIYLRNKQDGDFISLMGMAGTKKIKDIFIEQKLPISKRKTYPILVDNDNRVLWIPNIKKSKFTAKKSEFYDIILKYYKKGGNNE